MDFGRYLQRRTGARSQAAIARKLNISRQYYDILCREPWRLKAFQIIQLHTLLQIPYVELLTFISEAHAVHEFDGLKPVSRMREPERKVKPKGKPKRVKARPQE